MTDALQDDLVKLGVTLAEIARLIRALIHALNDRFQVLLRLHL